MTWDLAYCRDAERVANLTELNRDRDRFDGTTGGGWQGPLRHVVASAQFAGPAEQEREAAEAWAFEMKNYFLRGVGEPPVVTWKDGVYTVTGLISTTHPGDRPGPDGIVRFM